MTIVVLVKVVPDLDKMAFDPSQKTTVREGGGLFLNPLDSRALAVASTLRNVGEEIVALTMGPPTVAEGLVEALASGADRAVHVSDPALAGSDAVVTSLALARAVERIAPRVVLTGCVSTDSQVAHVPALVAARLGLPFVDHLRSLTPASQGGWQAISTTTEGRREVLVPESAVLAVGEKITKPPRFTPEQRESARLRPTVTWSLADLGLRPSQVGTVGSLTSVLAILSPLPRPPARVLATGDVSAMVAEAVEVISDRLDSPQRVDKPRSSVLAKPKLLVLLSPASGGLDRRSFDLLASVQRDLDGQVDTAGFGFGPLEASERHRLEGAGLNGVVWWPRVDGPVAAEALPLLVREARSRLSSVDALLVPCTTWTREAAARIAVAETWGLVTEAEGFELGTEGSLKFHKRSFGGNHLAVVATKGVPSVVTVRSSRTPESPSLTPALEWTDMPTPTLPSSLVREVGSVSELVHGAGDLGAARVVVGLGMGVGTPAGVAAATAAVRPLGAAIGGTRRVVDQGWLPPQTQIGLTGLFIAPDVYIAVGASGRPSHAVGINRARVVVALTTDPAAAIVSQADVVIVAPWTTSLAPLAEALARRRPDLTGLGSP